MQPGILTSPLGRVPGTVTQSLNINAEHVIVPSSPVAGTVTQSPNAEHVIVPSSPVAGTVTQSPNAEHVIVTSSPVAETITQNVTTTLATPTTSVSPLSSYLVHPVQNTTPTALKRSIPRARLLASDKSLALLEEKENAKKMALLENKKGK